MKMSVRCRIFGHNTEGQKIESVYTDMRVVGGIDDQGQLYSYRMRLCRRCGKRIPISEWDAGKKAEIAGHVTEVMNAARAECGLKPISWDD